MIISPPLVGPAEAERTGTWREDWMTSPLERRIIVGLINHVRAKRVVEIGVNEGWTAASILENCPLVESYLGVDVMPGYALSEAQAGELPEIEGEMALHDKRFCLHLARNGSLDLSAADIGPCDAMFIDGDHRLAVVDWDTQLARKCVRRPGGVIIWHDVHQSDVRQVLDLLAPNAIYVEDTSLAYEIAREPW